MTIRIDIDKLEDGLLLVGRNNKGAEAKAIRAGVHSDSNHNGTVVYCDGKWNIAEARPPVSALTPICEYERLINVDGYEVGFYRLKTLSVKQRVLSARYFIDNLLGLKYPRKRRMVLLALPIYNAWIDKTGRLPSMRLTWCSQLCKDAYLSQDVNCLDGRKGKKKGLFTPKTFENRILQHLFEDLTSEILVTE